MSEVCKWLHEQLERLPMISHPFNLEDLPENGIYFVYEEGEFWGHGGDQPRIVRVGSHTGQGNLRSRVNETYLLDESKLGFGPKNPKPADRSIFRKNLGRALLNRARDDYLRVWGIDFTERRHRDQFSRLRDMGRERRLEETISGILRDRFSFRAIAVESPSSRSELEKRIIGSLAGCERCMPSKGWLGRHSPKDRIREGNLWQVQNLSADPIGPREGEAIQRAIRMAEEQRIAHDNHKRYHVRHQRKTDRGPHRESPVLDDRAKALGDFRLQ